MIGHRLGVLDSPSYRPFINAFKQAWPWQADSGGAQWGSLVSGGHMRAGGQLIRIAPGSNGYRTRLFHNMPAQAGGTGRWRLRWNGQCTWDIYGASNVTRTANEIQFDFTANGSSWVDVVVRTIGSEVSGISLAHQSDWADQDAGRIFRRQFLQELRGTQALRFDEWIGILRSENEGGLRITSWGSRGLPSDEIFYRFVPYEWMCALANEVGAEPWICLPTAATDDHFRKAAELVRGLVPAPRRVHVEYSTKTWDFSGTPQAHYCSDRGRAAFNTTDGAAFRNWYGMRATQMALIWKDVWQNDPRLRTVVQHQADWVGGEVDILEAPLWRARSGQNGLPSYVAPHSVLDVLTVHAQIDGGMAYGGGAGQIDTWRTTLSQTEAFNRMRDRLLTGNSDRTVRVMTPKWRHYRNVASGYGMELSSYEVGNHLNGVGGSQGTRDFVHAFSVSSQMGEVYAATFNALEAEGFDGPLCMSVDCRLPDANISHGLQRWLGDHNPAWAAVDAMIEDAPVVVPPVEPEPEPEEPPVVVDPPLEPEPETPPAEPEPNPEGINMSTRNLLAGILSGLKEITEALEAYLDAPVVEPPVEEPEPVDPTPEPEPTPEPVDPLAGMRLPANIPQMSNNWSRGNLVLPNWTGTYWEPSLVQMNDDGSATLSTRIIGGAFRSGLMQIFRPTFTFGKVGAVFSVKDPNGVAAFFTYADNDKTEADFELVRRPGGSLAWQLNIHMFAGGRRNNPAKLIFVPVTAADLAQDHHYEIDYQDGFVAFYIDGKEVGRYTQADVPDAPWSKTAKFDTFVGTYRHTGWSGFTASDYAAPTTQMHVKGIRVPGL